MSENSKWVVSHRHSNPMYITLNNVRPTSVIDWLHYFQNAKGLSVLSLETFFKGGGGGGGSNEWGSKK